MSYIEQWKALAARIRGLTKAGGLYAQFQAINTDDSFGISQNLSEHCSSVVAALEEYLRTFYGVLPPEALRCLKDFVDGRCPKLIKNESAGMRPHAARAGLVFLSAFESEMSHLLSSQQELIRVRSERAFLHLQRLLAVDADIRAKWKAAFENKGEVSCERLGAVHLLWHGILAFKVDAIGARTDLVFNEPIEWTQLERGIEGLVLTEWKIAEAGKAEELFEQARKQAELYKLGPLAGSDYRYAVAVSLTDLPHVPDDILANGVTFRHINIAIEPKRPSQKARSK